MNAFKSNRTRMIRAALFCAAFVALLLIVGTVERGASAWLMVWAIPALSVMGVAGAKLN